MLGRLAKWLRILGHDVIYGQHLSGHGLIRAARADGRLILTRDRSLARKQPPPFLFIESNDYVEQLRQVLRACDLRPGEGLFTRCLVCNSRLQPRIQGIGGQAGAALCLCHAGALLLVRPLSKALLASHAPAENARRSRKNCRYLIIDATSIGCGFDRFTIIGMRKRFWKHRN